MIVCFVVCLIIDYGVAALGQMTERESAHPTHPAQFDEFSPMKEDELIAEIESVPTTDNIDSVYKF